MSFLNAESEICELRYEEERVLAFFTRRLIEISAVSGANGTRMTPAAVLNAMNLPAVAIDWNGIVVDMTAAASVVFDSDIKIKDRRIVVGDPVAQMFLEEAIEKLKTPRQIPLAFSPFLVRRRDKLPVIIRIWPFPAPSNPPFHGPASLMNAILSLFPIVDVYDKSSDYVRKSKLTSNYTI
jgi:hypothetical protein